MRPPRELKLVDVLIMREKTIECVMNNNCVVNVQSDTRDSDTVTAQDEISKQRVVSRLKATEGSQYMYLPHIS